MPVTPYGVFTLDEARRSGWSEDAVRRHVRAGRWRRLFRGVYVAADHECSALDRARAVVLASGGVASLLTAARAYGMWVVDEGDNATVPVATHRADRAGLRFVRAELPPQDVASLEGVPVTSAMRTLVDLCRRASRLQAVVAIESAVRLGLITSDQLTQLRASADRRVRQRAVVADPRSESVLETLVRLILRDAGIATEPQWQCRDEWGRCIYRIDLALPDKRIAIECDGAAFHGELKPIYRDRWRANRLHIDGWRVLRFTWFDATKRPEYVLATVQLASAAQPAVD